ncbi:MAG: hypothetical protein WDO18_05305 [Acidobacteriota bacterium]
MFIAGIERLGKPGHVLLAAFLAASIYEDVSWFRRPHENWQAAADTAVSQLQPGDCIEFIADAAPLFEYFHPELTAHRCAPDLAHRVVLAVTPYGDAQAYPRTVARLTARGLRKRSELSFNGPRIEVFQ